MIYGAFDTETVNRPGRGEACILIRDEGVIYEAPISWPEIFDFVAGRPRLCWNMDFDVRAIVHPAFLPNKPIEDLGLMGCARWGQYRFEYIPGKFFKAYCKGKPALVLYDLQQFFGLSLRAAAVKFLGPDSQKFDIPRSWYSEMDRCILDGRRTKVLRYAARDTGVVLALADNLFKSLAAAGVNLKAPTSCASIARSMFGKTLMKYKPLPAVNRWFSNALFGGRIEVGRLGLIGSCDLWDIHSAYPSVMHNMLAPDGEIIRTKTFSKEAAYGAYKIECKIPTKWHWGPLAVRRGIKIFYPVGEIITWAGRPALSLLQTLRIPFRIKAGWEIFSTGERLFPELADMYRKRKNPALALPFKLGPNALYGIMAERREKYFDSPWGKFIAGRKVRRSCIFGKYTNMPLAAHVTETIRMRIWGELHRAKVKAFFAATDGLLLSHGAPKPRGIGSGLGQWERKRRYTGGVILGCGRYALYNSPRLTWEKTGPRDFALRGFPVNLDSLVKIRRCKKRRAFITSLRSKSLRQWAGDPFSEANVLLDGWRKLEISDVKRAWSGKISRLCDAWTMSLDSKPFISV